MKRYFGRFRGIDDVWAEFMVTAADVTDAEILWAYYDTGSWEGDARVVFQREGRVYEVAGGHCSCNGLEGVWGDPIEVSWSQLAMRPAADQATYGDADATAAWTEMVHQHAPRA